MRKELPEPPKLPNYSLATEAASKVKPEQMAKRALSKAMKPPVYRKPRRDKTRWY